MNEPEKVVLLLNDGSGREVQLVSTGERNKVNGLPVYRPAGPEELMVKTPGPAGKVRDEQRTYDFAKSTKRNGSA
jgi:hypothetical protein